MRTTTLSAFFFLLLFSSLGVAQIPRTLSYQGILTDSLGTPKPDGSYTFTFRLYDASTGGASIWEEQKTLTLAHGLFSAALGDQVIIGPEVQFDRPYWLGVTVGTEGEMTPRTLLTAVCYSLNSSKADTARFALAAPQFAVVDTARIAYGVVNNAIASTQIVNGTITRADVASSFSAPYADTAQYARVAPQGGFVDSTRIAGSLSFPQNIDGSFASPAFNVTMHNKDGSAFYGQNNDNGNAGAIATSLAGLEGWSLTEPAILARTKTGVGLYAEVIGSPSRSDSSAAIRAKGRSSATGIEASSVVCALDARAYYDAIRADGTVYINDAQDGGVAVTIETRFGDPPADALDCGATARATGGLYIHRLPGFVGRGKPGVYGVNDGNAMVPGDGGPGVEGRSLHFEGVRGSTEDGIGVYGSRDDGGDYAGYFSGNVQVTGTLTKGAGAFRIDHPLDPANKYLQHSFVESPDMKDVYDGIAVLDDAGEAVVQLPAYFEALNSDFRYQLTCIGGYSPVFVSQEIKANQFVIKGGKGGQKVSWQVTGIRHDAYAEAHRITAEVDKPPEERGMFLYPKEQGVPTEKGIDYLHASSIKQVQEANAKAEARLKVKQAEAQARRQGQSVPFIPESDYSK
jgi:hypothetical protein